MIQTQGQGRWVRSEATSYHATSSCLRAKAIRVLPPIPHPLPAMVFHRGRSVTSLHWYTLYIYTLCTSVYTYVPENYILRLARLAKCLGGGIDLNLSPQGAPINCTQLEA